MTLAFSTAVLQDRLQALTRAIDAGSAAGFLNLYDGTRPSTGGAVTTQVKLAALRFADPSAGSISGLTLTLLLGAPVLALKSGIATWARITDSDGNFVADMDVGATGSNKEVELTATQVYEGGEVSAAVASLVES